MSSSKNYMQFFWSFFVLALLVLVPVLAVTPSGAQAQTVEIGVVRTMSGTAHILRDGARIQPAIGGPVQEGDILRTGTDGSIGVALSDNAVLSVGPDSEFHLVEFAFQPRNEIFSFLARILLGTFVYTSGDIGRLSPDSVAIETPVGVIGIRGTRFAGSVGP